MGVEPQGKVDALTGLRFFAAFSILVSHTAAWTAPFTSGNPVSNIAAMLSVYGMPLFFVLSGFVIHYNYALLFRKRRWGVATGEFFIARFARLYPLYFCFFVVGMISDFTVNWLNGYLPDLIKLIATSLTLTQSWFYVIVVNHRLLLENAFGLGWSVSTEWFFYCAYVVLVFAMFQLRTPKATLAAIISFSCLAVAILIFADAQSGRLVSLTREYLTDDSAVTSTDYGVYRWFFYYSPYVRLLEFILGCLTAQLYLLVSDRPPIAFERKLGSIVLWGSLVVLGFIGLFFITGTPSAVFDHYLNFLVLNFGCAVPISGVIFCVSRYDSAVSRLLSVRRLVGLGEISYSIYAVHTWTLRAFLRPPVAFDLANGLESLVRIPVAMMFTVIMATATYRVIEMPSRRVLRDRLTRLFEAWLRFRSHKVLSDAPASK
jgi:peptidoglycan/LPS O-acetylase OafA/YrhL